MICWGYPKDDFLRWGEYKKGKKKNIVEETLDVERSFF